MLTLFICSMSAEIAVICFRYVPRMSRPFRVGFSMLGAGCIMGFLVMAEMCLSLLARHLTFLAVLVRPDFPYHQLELVATVLAGAGLTIPAVAGRAARKTCTAGTPKPSHASRPSGPRRCRARRLTGPLRPTPRRRYRTGCTGWLSKSGTLNSLRALRRPS